MLQRESSMSGRDEGQGRRAVLIAGPTASGKSALATALAERTGGVIVNADSMQVYRDLRVITARPAETEEARVTHRLYGHVDAGEPYSAARWLTDARAALDEAHAAGRLPIVVGGTGLYFKLLTQGLAEVPQIPAEIRAALRTRLVNHGAAALHAELQRRDPVTAERIRPGDGSRILRALEVIEATGRSLAEWQQGNMPPVLEPAQGVVLFLNCERDELRRRIDARFDGMLNAGALEEVRALAERNLDPLLPAMKAHGVPWLIRHLRGEISLDEAAAQGKADTKRYTKRQFTWFRHQLPDWPWIAPASALDHLQAALARAQAGRG
jgi:tRNA dimethylallyltransferase